ncbi:hypothetical protein J2W43_002310 [Pseudomonas brassicacearum]|uniref:Uncharacterized protein n=1 Tax=Pseudomonas brassicacearum TaxID=930166 RepID=A0AAW8MAF4_9PSED|nr:hypothetical protein [Pseudomonas brassicacearum]
MTMLNNPHEQSFGYTPAISVPMGPAPIFQIFRGRLDNAAHGFGAKFT